MMRPGILLAIGLLVVAGCTKDHDDGGLPPCLESHLSHDPGSMIQQVKEYWFHDQKVYEQVVDDDCRDCPTVVVDAHCNTVCSCCGISGVPEGPVEEFSSGAQFLRVVWTR